MSPADSSWMSLTLGTVHLLPKAMTLPSGLFTITNLLEHSHGSQNRLTGVSKLESFPVQYTGQTSVVPMPEN